LNDARDEKQDARSESVDGEYEDFGGRLGHSCSLVRLTGDIPSGVLDARTRLIWRTRGADEFAVAPLL